MNGENLRQASEEQLRAALRTSLQTRRHEIEQAMLARMYSVSDPTEADDASLDLTFRWLSQRQIQRPGGHRH